MRLKLIRDIVGIIIGSLLLFFGTANILLAYSTEYHHILAIITGVIICVIGSGLLAIGLYSFYKTNLVNFTVVIMGGTLISLACAIFINPQLILDVLATFLSVSFFIAAALSIIYSIKGLVTKTRFFTAILGLMFAFILIILGILLIVEEHISELSFVLVVIGSIVNILGIIFISASIFHLIMLKKKKAIIDDAIIIDEGSNNK